MKDGLKVRGMFRIHIEDNGEIVGDSGWVKNQITDLGFNQFLVSALGSISGSKYVSHVALGTGTAPGTSATTLNGELGEAVRKAVTAATSSTSKVLNLVATFASADSFVTNTRNISNIGLFNSSSGGTLFAGNTFTSSAVATNQAVNVTYNISFT